MVISTLTKMKEAGYEEALYGLSLSYGATLERMVQIAPGKAKQDLGHNKFLEQIDTWWILDLPRYVWSQFDTYRIDMSKQSESTMHTLLKMLRSENLRWEDRFEIVPNEDTKRDLLTAAACKDKLKAKQILPECFIQRRVIKCSYKTLRQIILQREDHELPHWKIFCDEVRKQVDHPELLP